MEKLQKVYDKAVDLIDTLLYTDLCFLYQPSQIALAAMKIACRQESYDFEKYVSIANFSSVLSSIDSILFACSLRN